MSIILSDLTKRFGRNLVVNRVNLEIHDGELFVLLGGSGSGKSTILRLISGLIRPDSGKIELHGKDVTYLSPQVRSTGFVFQNYSVFRHMTVAQNVDFGLKIRNSSASERRKRVDELLDLVGLAGLGERFADQLSGGQQQRVALARALAYQPSVLLLDEPFSALDVKIRAQLRQSVREIQEQLRVTTILVTHDQEEAFELADRIGVIEGGQIIEVNTPESLYHTPSSEFAAVFVGSGNVLAGRRDHQNIRLGQVYLPLPKNMPDYEEGAPVRILFRPETVELSVTPREPGRSGFELGEGMVEERVFAGALQRLTLSVDKLQGARPLMPRLNYGESKVRIEAVIPSEATNQPQLEVGNKVWINLPRYHVLQPSGLKVLICTEPTTHGKTVAEVGMRLADAAGGPATLMTVATDPGKAVPIRSHLDELRERFLENIPLMQSRVRQGVVVDEILAEISENDHEVVVVGRSDNDLDSRLGNVSREIFLHSDAPVLFVTENRLAFRKILILTAAGEPGKTDVSFGGRVARRTEAEATVMHVMRPEADHEERQRIRRHMHQARSLLDALGVPNYELLAEGKALEEILAEIQRGKYDLVVLGAPAPRLPQRLVWSDLTIQVITQTVCPVMVVPMSLW